MNGDILFENLIQKTRELENRFSEAVDQSARFKSKLLDAVRSEWPEARRRYLREVEKAEKEMDLCDFALRIINEAIEDAEARS